MAIGRATRLLILAMWAVLLGSSSVAAAGQDVGWRQAVDRLAQEKALAEGCASVLKTFADDAPMARVQGQRLYARARADMDGLLALLIMDLASERSPAEIPDLSQRLETVPEQRRALCRHADATIGTALRQHRNAAALLAAGSGATTSSLINAAVQIWKAYRAADQVSRAAIISGIEAARWLAYAAVPVA